MAAPTNVRVYATSLSTAVLRWTYAGTSGISVYRSTDGAAYSVVTSTLLPTDTSYTNTGLSTATKYWYKLSDDLGSTFSSVVTVYSHACLSNAGGDDTLVLPRTNGEAPAGEFDDLAERIENALNGRVLAPSQCAVCPSDGRVVIDCSNGCSNFAIIADEDINSISIQWCGEGNNNIDVILPPNTSGRQVCGWPGGFGFSGDECFSAPVSSGSDGKTISVGSGSGGRANPGTTSSRPGTNTGIGRGSGGAGGASCACVTTGNGALTIKSCNANNSLNCSSTKSLKLIACGGRGPYAWSKTGSVVLSKTSGETTTVTPPANAGSGVAGVAYKKGLESVACGHTVGTAHGSCGLTYTSFGCDDVSTGACTSISDGLLPQTFVFAFDTVLGGPCSCGEHSGHAVTCSSGATVTCTHTTSVATACADSRSFGAVMDRRTAGMISNGCAPCALNEGATVSVTDSIGTVVTVILKA
jgi:hypothetical protein